MTSPSALNMTYLTVTRHLYAAVTETSAGGHGVEQRTSRSVNPQWLYAFEGTTLTYTQAAALRAHFVSAAYGLYDFEFSCPFTGETIHLRYDETSWEESYSSGVFKLTFSAVSVVDA